MGHLQNSPPNSGTPKRHAGMVKCQDCGGVLKKSKQWQELTNFVFGFVYVQASTLSHGSSKNSV